MTATTHTAMVPAATSIIARTVCGLDLQRHELVPHGEATCNDCYPRTRLTDGAVVRLLLSQAPILSTELARGLATRWAAWERVDPDVACKRTSAAAMTDSEREQLFAWVRAASERYSIPGGYKSLAADLGISEDEAAALCQDVWPS